MSHASSLKANETGGPDVCILLTGGDWETRGVKQPCNAHGPQTS
jgi:hypothetical protein